MVAILYQTKWEIKQRDKEGQYIIINRSIQQKDKTFVNIYIPKCTEKILTNLTEKYTAIP